jgi:hypothetical protein
MAPSSVGLRCVTGSNIEIMVVICGLKKITSGFYE